MADIRPAGAGGSGRDASGRGKNPRPFFEQQANTTVVWTKTKPKKSKRNLKRVLLWLAIIFVLVTGFYALRVQGIKRLAQQSSLAINENLKDAKTALYNFDPATAKTSFEAFDSQIQTLHAEAGKFGLLQLASAWGTVVDKFKKVPTFFQDLIQLSKSAIRISENIVFLKDHAFPLMFNKEGEKIIDALTALRNDLHTLPDTLAEFKNKSDSFNYTVPGDFLSLQIGLYKNEQLLDAIIGWLSSPLEKHLAILFENSSELRPGGGFVGSYADVGIQRASITTLTVRDIYDPDGQLSLKVIPPQPLQIVTKTWGARDANWFFDFPTSARKIMYFLNNSKLYSEQLRSFEGVIAINVSVLQDLLSVTGPIELPEYKLTITGENFLSEIQKEVESGADKAKGEPKRMLKILTPLLLERISALSNEQKKILIELIAKNTETRDIRLYMDDVVIESQLVSLGLGGEVSTAPEKGLFEYLAVANANVAGQKSDALMSQKIDFVSTISLEGKISNELALTRKHAGQNQKAAWYRATNKDYVQVLAPLKSTLLESSGREKWPEIPKWDYEGFKTDPDVAAIEATTKFIKVFGIDQFNAFGKTVFAAWLNTPAGTTKTLRYKYQNAQVFKFEPETPYTFIYEKQPGAATQLSLKLIAPPGYTWKEARSATYLYESADPPGRLTISLTLIPVE